MSRIPSIAAAALVISAFAISACSDPTGSDSKSSPSASAEETAVVATYHLILVDGSPPPHDAGAIINGPPGPFGACDLIVDGGTLTLGADLRFTMNTSNHPNCPNGSGGFNAGSSVGIGDGGDWSLINGTMSMQGDGPSEITINGSKLINGVITISVSGPVAEEVLKFSR